MIERSTCVSGKATLFTAHRRAVRKAWWNFKPRNCLASSRERFSSKMSAWRFVQPAYAPDDGCGRRCDGLPPSSGNSRCTVALVSCDCVGDRSCHCCHAGNGSALERRGHSGPCGKHDHCQRYERLSATASRKNMRKRTVAGSLVTRDKGAKATVKVTAAAGEKEQVRPVPSRGVATRHRRSST